MALLVKNLLANAGYARDMGLIPGLGRLPGERKQHPPLSCLGNLMDRAAWWAAVYGAANNKTQLSTRKHMSYVISIM